MASDINYETQECEWKSEHNGVQLSHLCALFLRNCNWTSLSKMGRTFYAHTHTQTGSRIRKWLKYLATGVFSSSCISLPLSLSFSLSSNLAWMKLYLMAVAFLAFFNLFISVFSNLALSFFEINTQKKHKTQKRKRCNTPPLDTQVK